VVALRDRVRLQQNLASLGEMAAGLTHELKNSLATIQGYSQLVARLAPEEASQPSSALVDEVRYLSQMVTDFLNFARPHAPNLLPASLERLVDECVTRISNRAREADIDVTVAVDESARGIEVEADETLLSRAILNVLNNAVDVLEETDGTRTIAVTVIAESAEDVVVEIADSGPGINPDDLDRIFIPFFTTKSRGHGIGLALTQKIVLSHHGQIDVESSPSGTSFRFRLPTV